MLGVDGRCVPWLSGREKQGLRSGKKPLRLDSTVWGLRTETEEADRGFRDQPRLCDPL